MLTSSLDNKNHENLQYVRSIHTAIQGRARYKIAGLRGSKKLKEYLESELPKQSGVLQVKANPDTGNILITFHWEYSPEDIAEEVDRLVQLIKTLRPQKPPLKRREKREMTNALTHLMKSVIDLVFPQKNKGSTAQPLPLDIGKDPPPEELWHLWDSEKILTHLHTSLTTGLSKETAKKYLHSYGKNALPETPPRSKIALFLDQYKTLPVALLGLAAGVSLMTGGVIDATVILGVVLINGIIGFSTESQSERIIHSLKHLVKPSALIIRDNRTKEISAEEVVIGDILILKPGTYIVADARVLDSQYLSVDESALTGESMPVIKSAEPLTLSDTPLADRTNMVYMGTLVTGGQGLAVVVATGAKTEIGKIQLMVGETEIPETPMQQQLNQAGSQLVYISSGICGLVFLIGLWRGYGWIDMLKTSISLAVAAVPEGLPTVATTTLALGIQEMRKHKVLIRKLDAVEALGSVQSICLDKTGTLTANKMSVVELFSDDQIFSSKEGKLYQNNQLLYLKESHPLSRLIHILILCNESQITGKTKTKGQDKYMFKGSSTENALVELALEVGMDVIAIREKFPLLKIHHRSQDQNYMKTIHQMGTKTEQKLVAVKGNPGEVLALCNWQIKKGKTIPLTEADKTELELENDRMAGQALRVLGIAYGHTDDPESPVHEDLVWLGLVGMADPIRKGVKEVIATFHHAGINTVMITGDQSPTAYAIGKELNLSGNDHLEILDSSHLNELEPELLTALSNRVHIFSRISPANKLQIVQALQRSGQVVAMTGDGINDAPALKASQVGVAMGHTGTDVAREVADVILEDDELQTMIIAISRGRTIYSNIRKSVHFLLATNLSEIMVMLIATALGMGHPLTALQLLWLNLVTDIFPGLALALDPPDPDVLNQPPRDPEESIISQQEFKQIAWEGLLISASSMSAYGYGLSKYGISPQASTLAFMSLTLGQLLQSYACRSQKHSIWSQKHLEANPHLNVAIGGSIGLQLLLIAIPSLRQVMNIVPVTPVDAGIIALTAVLPLLITETVKEAKTLLFPASTDVQLLETSEES